MGTPVGPSQSESNQQSQIAASSSRTGETSTAATIGSGAAEGVEGRKANDSCLKDGSQMTLDEKVKRFVELRKLDLHFR